MKIENQELIVSIDGDEVVVPLPDVKGAAIVKAWQVPVEYRENGIFISVSRPGDIEEFPACDTSQVAYLGEIEIEASESDQLHFAKNAKMIEINTACNRAVGQLAENYPEREIQTWPQQVKEAEALSANAEAETPLLSAIAASRGITAADLAARVLAKMTAYASASGAIIGHRQSLEDLVEAAESTEDVSGIHW